MSDTYNDRDYRDRLVAFLDILGFRRFISQESSSAVQSINKLDGVLTKALSFMEFEYGVSFSTRLFSDCICISCDYSLENLFYILFQIASIQQESSCNEIFLRGAVSRGAHFENSRMIFSQGLVNAYELEKVAIYPRILIDRRLVQHIKEDSHSYSPHYTDFYTRDFVIESPDGHHSLDYLQVLRLEGFDCEEALAEHKRSIEALVRRNMNDPKVIDKYRWVVEYHNAKVHELLTPDDYEDEWRSIVSSVGIDPATAFPRFKKL